MTLAFAQQLNGKPTYFVEKIYESFKHLFVGKEMIDYIKSDYHSNTEKEWRQQPKRHTIRADSKNRWRAGMNIHFVINNRTKNRLQFLPVLPCISVQEFEIKYRLFPNETAVKIWIDGFFEAEAFLAKGKIKDYCTTFEEIALNDGFDSVNDFLEYFSEDFEGKLIHWTDLKY